MIAIFKREFKSYFINMSGYVFIGVLWLFSGIFTTALNLIGQYAAYEYALSNLVTVLMLIVPILTMRSMSEDRRAKTDMLLYSLPVSSAEVVLGKYFAGVALVVLALIPTLIYFFSVYHLSQPVGNVDIGGIWGSYIGLFFLSATFVSIGLFCSSITNNQILAFLLSVFLCGFLYIGFDMIYSMALFGKVDLFIQHLGMSSHYSSLSRGVIDTRDILYFISVIVLFLSSTKLVLSSRKW